MSLQPPTLLPPLCNRLYRSQFAVSASRLPPLCMQSVVSSRVGYHCIPTAALTHPPLVTPHSHSPRRTWSSLAERSDSPPPPSTHTHTHTLLRPHLPPHTCTLPAGHGAVWLQQRQWEGAQIQCHHTAFVASSGTCLLSFFQCHTMAI